MDALDPWALIEWIYDPIEDRFGRLAAWLATFAVAVITLGAIAWITVALWSN